MFKSRSFASTPQPTSSSSTFEQQQQQQVLVNVVNRSNIGRITPSPSTASSANVVPYLKQNTNNNNIKSSTSQGSALTAIRRNSLNQQNNNNTPVAISSSATNSFSLLQLQEERARNQEMLIEQKRNGLGETATFSSHYNYKLKSMLKGAPAELQFLAPKLSAFTGNSSDDDEIESRRKEVNATNNNFSKVSSGTFMTATPSSQFQSKSFINQNNSNTSGSFQQQETSVSLTPAELITSISRISQAISPAQFRKYGVKRLEEMQRKKEKEAKKLKANNNNNNNNNKKKNTIIVRDHANDIDISAIQATRDEDDDDEWPDEDDGDSDDDDDSDGWEGRRRHSGDGDSNATSDILRQPIGYTLLKKNANNNNNTNIKNNTTNASSSVAAIKKKSPGRNTSSITLSQEEQEKWNRLAALPKHVADRVKPVWRHRAGLQEMAEGEDIATLRPSDRLRVLRNDPALRREFRKRVAQEDRDRKQVFDEQMMARLQRQRESDISVACAAVARQTDKLTHDEEEGRGPGFGMVTMSRAGGRQNAPSGRVIRQYFEYATREMQMWRRAQRLSTVEERGKQLQHSRDLRFEEELMQTEKALETRAGETELEIRQNFIITAVIQALIMIEWHGQALEVLNPKSRSIRSVAIKAQLLASSQKKPLLANSSATSLPSIDGTNSSPPPPLVGTLDAIKERFGRWSRSLAIPMNVCMYQRTVYRKRHAARLVMNAWAQNRDQYFETKRNKSATIISHFMRDMGQVLSFTVACRRLKRIVNFVQHHWRGRETQREARKELLIRQLRKQSKIEIELSEKDIERFAFVVKQQEKDVAGKRGLQRLTGAESAHRVINDMTLRIQESTDYAERLKRFRENEIEEVAWKYVLRLVAEYDHKLVRYVHAFQRYRQQAGIPHGNQQFIVEQQMQIQRQQELTAQLNANNQSSPTLMTSTSNHFESSQRPTSADSEATAAANAVAAVANTVVRPTRPFFRRLLPEEDVRAILKAHCGDASANSNTANKETGSN